MSDQDLAVDGSRIRLRWKIIARAESDPGGDYDLKLSESPGIVGQYDADPSQWLGPHNVTLDKSAHDRIFSRLQSFRVDRSARFPISLRLDASPIAQVNLTLRWYPPRLYCLTIDAYNFNSESVSSELLVKLQRDAVIDLLAHSALAEIQRRMGHSVRRISTIPGTYLEAELPELDENQSGLKELISVAIRAQPAHTLTGGLITEFLSKNSRINQKTNQELLLVDKQGMLLTRSPGSSGQHQFKKTHDLAEIALILSAVLDLAPTLRIEHPEYLDFLMGRIRGWIEQPGTELRATMSYRLVMELLIQELMLGPRLEQVSASLEPVLALGESASPTVSRDWWRDPNFFETVADLSATAASLDFAFVADAALRQILARDLREAHRCRDSHSYKAAIVLAGSVVEAALLDALISSQAAPAADLKKLMMGKLIEKANQSAVLPSEPGIQGAIVSLQDYRNLIHPGKEDRTATAPTRERANHALAAMDVIIQSLAARAQAPATAT